MEKINGKKWGTDLVRVDVIGIMNSVRGKETTKRKGSKK
jgi:hypothetical protein